MTPKPRLFSPTTCSPSSLLHTLLKLIFPIIYHFYINDAIHKRFATSKNAIVTYVHSTFTPASQGLTQNATPRSNTTLDGCNTQRVESDEDRRESENSLVKMIEETCVEKTECDGVEDTWESGSVETGFGDPDIGVVFFGDGEGCRSEKYWS
ncbi:hypothetical protein EAF00_007423 [Botryotinia globosa]|nr:hypothetical protein EAF00_007423 [Botryotinia globosa]